MAITPLLVDLDDFRHGHRACPSIWGVAIWIIRNEKNPMRAIVTAAIATIRAAPSLFEIEKILHRLPSHGREAICATRQDLPNLWLAPG
jgi:hypothetical protein